MNKIKAFAYILFLLLLINTTINYSQNDSSETIQDTIITLFSKGEYKLRLNNSYNIISPLSYNRQQIFFDEPSLFYYPDFNLNTMDKPISMMQLKQETNEAMMIYRQGLLKNDLGFVGDVLRYTNTAAALGLAVYHVYKYRDRYK